MDFKENAEIEEKNKEKTSIEKLIENTMQNLHNLIETNVVVGEPVYSPSGVIIIPVSKVSVGYVVGGGEYADVSVRKKIENYPLAGGSGGGVSISPIGFLIEDKNGVNYIDIENKTAYQSALNLFNKLVNKVCNDKTGAEDEK